jgi:hypothetical protein
MSIIIRAAKPLKPKGSKPPPRPVPPPPPPPPPPQR